MLEKSRRAAERARKDRRKAEEEAREAAGAKLKEAIEAKDVQGLEVLLEEARAHGCDGAMAFLACALFALLSRPSEGLPKYRGRWAPNI